MTLEDLLREAAAKGLTHLSLHPVPSEDGKSTYWRASATPSTQHKYVQAATHDPAEAVRIVLEALPRAPRRSAPKPRFDKENPPLSEMAQRDAVTAAVKEPVEGGPFRGIDQTTFKDTGDPVDLHDGPNDEWSRFK